MVELDNLDVKILTHLQGNSRKSFQEIAKSCLTSVPTIKSRVDRLVELGIIGGAGGVGHVDLHGAVAAVGGGGDANGRLAADLVPVGGAGAGTGFKAAVDQNRRRRKSVQNDLLRHARHRA